jgi:hypothetical protein
MVSFELLLASVMARFRDLSSHLARPLSLRTPRAYWISNGSYFVTDGRYCIRALILMRVRGSGRAQLGSVPAGRAPRWTALPSNTRARPRFSSTRTVRTASGLAALGF